MKTLAIVLLVCAAFSARTSAQTVELPLRETLLQRPGQHPRAIYSMPVRVGSTLIETGVDTGSIGLRVLPNVLKPEDAQAGEQPETYGYESGNKIDGVVGTARIALGDRAAEGRLQLIRTLGCYPNRPHCPATQVGGPEHFGLMGQGIPDAGFKAIAGLGFMQPKPGAPDNPFVELGVNRYLIDLPRSEGVTGRIILDPSAEDTKDFVELPNANADEIFGTAAPPDTVPGCLVKLEDSQMICGSLLFDSAAAPGIRVRLPGGQRGEWPLDTPGRIIFDDGHGHTLASEDFVAGPTHSADVYISGAPPQQTQPIIHVGVVPYLAFSVLYDVTRHGLALRPLPEAPGAPVGRVP
jgi:hypothetical protein